MESTSRSRKFFGSKSFIMFLAIVAIAAVFTALNKNYLSPDNIKNIFSAASLSGTVAVGLAILLMSGQIDLSTGAIGMISALVMAFLLKGGIAWVPALILSMLFGGLIGLVNAFFANVLNFMSFISTLAMSTALAGVGMVVTNAQNIAVSDRAFWAVGSTVLFKVIPVPFLIVIVLYFVYGFMLTRTRFGRQIYMCGGNYWAARLAGINPKKITTILFVNNGMIAALAGCVLAARMHMASPSAVIGSEMTGLTAAILGGVSFTGGSGGMGGAFIGLILLNAFTNGLVVVGLDPYWQIVASGVLLILALMIDFFREKARIRAIRELKRVEAK